MATKKTAAVKNETYVMFFAGPRPHVSGGKINTTYGAFDAFLNDCESESNIYQRSFLSYKEMISKACSSKDEVLVMVVAQQGFNWAVIGASLEVAATAKNLKIQVLVPFQNHHVYWSGQTARNAFVALGELNESRMQIITVFDKVPGTIGIKEVIAAIDKTSVEASNVVIITDNTSKNPHNDVKDVFSTARGTKPVVLLDYTTMEMKKVLDKQ